MPENKSVTAKKRSKLLTKSAASPPITPASVCSAHTTPSVQVPANRHKKSAHSPEPHKTSPNKLKTAHNTKRPKTNKKTHSKLTKTTKKTAKKELPKPKPNHQKTTKKTAPPTPPKR